MYNSPSYTYTVYIPNPSVDAETMGYTKLSLYMYVYTVFSYTHLPLLKLTCKLDTVRESQN